MITNPIVLTNALKAKKRQEEEIMQMRILNTKYKNFVFFRHCIDDCFDAHIFNGYKLKMYCVR